MGGISIPLLNAKILIMNLSYIINVLGEESVLPSQPVSPPIVQTSNFSFGTVDDLRKAITSERDSYIYSRGNNPTVDLLRKKLAALEDTEDALVFASGMAAISSAIISNVQTGSHIVCVREPYSWTNSLLNTTILPRFGVEVTMVDGRSFQEVAGAVKPNTSVIYLESPNSWTFELQDLQRIAEFARSKGILTMIDNSYSTPLYQKPVKFGIDLVLHTASKYLNGHSDVVAGVCCGSKNCIDRIFNNEYLTFGGIISPLNAWLMLRGLRTLPIRMAHITYSAEKIINHLSMQKAVRRLYYPGSASDPQQELAVKQMKHSSGLFTIQTRTEDIGKIEKYCNELTYFRLAVSWGGYESLVIPSCTFIRPGLYQALPSNLIRFSVGLEEPEELIADLMKNIDLLMD